MILPVLPGGAITEIELAKAGTTSYTVPAGQMYWLFWVALKYVADATVATRVIRIEVTWTNGTDKTTLCYLGGVVASETKYATYGIASGECTLDGSITSDSGSGTAPFPLYPGMKLGISVANGQAGDVWTTEGVMSISPLGIV